MAKRKKTEAQIVPISVHSQVSVAQELFDVETQLAQLEERKDFLRKTLLDVLKITGVQSVKLINGDSYVRAQGKRKLVIKNKDAAMKWALEHPTVRMKLDESQALSAISLTPGGLSFFNIERGNEYLQIKRSKNNESNGEVDAGD